MKRGFKIQRENPPLNFLGLPPEYSEYDKAKVAVLPVSYEGTVSYGLGTAAGPGAIIDASRYLEWYDMEMKSELHRECGIYTCEELAVPSDVYPESVVELVYSKAKILLDDGKFFVLLGGEHTVSLGGVKAVSEKYGGNISVLQIDAHADLREEYEGTKYSHASVMRRALPYVRGITSVGIRSMSYDEAEFVKGSSDVKVFSGIDIFDGKFSVEEIVGTLSDNVYVTIDVDGFDYSVVSSTGTPEPGGISWWWGLKLLRKTAFCRNIVAFDIVEHIPDNRNAQSAAMAKLCFKVLSYIFL